MTVSLFAGFNKAVRAMQSAQYGLNVHGQNIANSAEPSYTRKELLPPSETVLNGPGVLRIRDAFIDDSFRRASGSLGEGEVRRNVMSKVEDIFGDPVEGGVRKSLDQFYDAWQGLAENPSDGVARLQVLAAARSFAQQIQYTYRELSGLEQTVNEELATRVQQVNTKLTTVHELNRRISELHRSRMDDSDLRDQRDKALDELAKLTGAQAIVNDDGTIRVVIGSTVVLDGPTRLDLVLKSGPTGPVPAWGSTGVPYSGTGTIKGLVTVRDTDIIKLKSDIDTLGRAVANSTNLQHAAGYGMGGSAPIDFFVISAAPADITVNPLLTTDKIAAASDPAGLPTDGDNARALAALADKTDPSLISVVIPGQEQSPRMFYRNLVGWLGTRSQDAVQLEEIAKSRVQISTQHRQSEWGVSLDEEVAGLTMQQKAFAAAARVITVMDEMLDTLINRTGR